jgi:diamine N-acetyltransferase
MASDASRIGQPQYIQETQLEYSMIQSNHDLSDVVKVLNEAHLTVAEEFGFSKDSNPTNNAFIDASTLKTQLEKGILLYSLAVKGKPIGCIAIEKSTKEHGTFYIEKVSVLPECRHRGYGKRMMEFAADQIRENGGKRISIALIDSNARLKNWYSMQGFKETGTGDFPHLPFRVCFMSKGI